MRTHTAARGEPGPFGIHTLPLAQPDGQPSDGRQPDRRQLVGPFPEGDRFVVVEATERRNRYVAFEDVQEDVLAAMQAEPRAVVHQLLLDTGFDAAAVTFEDTALASALPLPTASPARSPAT